MVRLEPINGNNVWSIMDLAVHEEQKTFVADNRTSMIEAYITTNAGGHVFPFGIYHGDVAVGFVMIGYGTDDEWMDPPEIAEGNYNIWRLMIDKHQQGNGYGRQALKLVLDFIESMPCGEAPYCWLSYEPENKAAKTLYQSFGFSETGAIDGDEMIAIRPLRKKPSPGGEGGTAQP